MSKSKKWFNNRQLEVMAVGANNVYVVASRGFGKSEGIDAPELIRRARSMPRSAGALLSPTYAKLLTNTLPAVCHALEGMGYRRDIHYVIGRKPPKTLNYLKPHIEPFRYDYVMYFAWGSILHFISFDRPMSANSLSLDYILGFEAKYLDYSKIINEVFPANRGNEQYFGHCPWHHGLVFTTDMPTSKSGSWILEKENEMDQELIDMIKMTYAEIQYYQSLPGDRPFHKRRIAELRRDITLFRKNATFYGEFDIFDNLEVIGEKRIRDFKRDLPGFVFQTAILNQRPRKVPNGFYSALNEKIHYYESYNNPYLDSLDYDFKRSTVNSCIKDGDLITDQPLRIALDYNAAINNVVTGQVTEHRLMTNNWQFVKTPRKLQELCNDWCDYYDSFPRKDVVYYYDSTAIASTADGDAKPFYEIVTNMLTARGWHVIQAYIGQQMRHDTKHMHVDQALKGDPNYLFPQFNKHNCEFLTAAMEQTGVKIGRNGFEKDKGIEKTPDSPESPDELKTHGTDAWDTLFIGCNFHNVPVDSVVPTAATW